MPGPGQDTGSNGDRPNVTDGAVLHASCVSYGDCGLLILGSSGSGKSSLALSLMALGAALVADDRVIISSGGSYPVADVPERLKGMIEARGVGLLRADAFGPARIGLVVDLDRTESRRLPTQRLLRVAGHDVPLLYRVESPSFTGALLQFLRAGRAET